MKTDYGHHHRLGVEDPSLGRRLRDLEARFAATGTSPHPSIEAREIQAAMDRARDLRARMWVSALRGALGTARSAVAALVRVVRSVGHSVVEGHRRRIAIRELSSLDDRLLHDIGLHRSAIPAAVAGLLNRAVDESPADEGADRSIRAPRGEDCLEPCLDEAA